MIRWLHGRCEAMQGGSTAARGPLQLCQVCKTSTVRCLAAPSSELRLCTIGGERIVRSRAAASVALNRISENGEACKRFRLDPPSAQNDPTRCLEANLTPLTERHFGRRQWDAKAGFRLERLVTSTTGPCMVHVGSAYVNPMTTRFQVPAA